MNNVKVNCEFHFHEQEVLSIFHETNSSGRDEQFAELAFAAAFTIRSFSNIGACEATDTLGHGLVTMGHLIAEMRDEIFLVKPTIINYPGHAGRKQIIANLQLNSSRMKLDYSWKGFGWLASGIGYYATATVIPVFRYFAGRRFEDETYLAALGNIAAGCGQLHLEREIQVTNHPQLVLLLITNFLDDYVPEWM